MIRYVYDDEDDVRAEAVAVKNTLQRAGKL